MIEFVDIYPPKGFTFPKSVDIIPSGSTWLLMNAVYTSEMERLNKMSSKSIKHSEQRFNQPYPNEDES